MSILFYLIKAAIIGFAIAAPIGPIGIICIRKTLEHGLIGAIAVGIGASLADGVYAIIAVAGLTVISGFLVEKASIINIVGGIFLIYLAYIEIKNNNKTSSSGSKKNKNINKLIYEVFFLTLTNPVTILTFIAIFASISVSSVTFFEAVAMVIGIFIGSMIWWLILGLIVSKIKHKLPEEWINKSRYLSAIILSCFGVLAICFGLFTR